VAAPHKTRFREKRRTAVAWSASAAVQAALEFFGWSNRSALSGALVTPVGSCAHHFHWQRFAQLV